MTTEEMTYRLGLLDACQRIIAYCEAELENEPWAEERHGFLSTKSYAEGIINSLK